MGYRYSYKWFYRYRHTLVGPPDRLSNIRPVRHSPPISPAEVRVQKLEREVCKYNHQFWAQHNCSFQEKKNAFAKSRLPKGEERLSVEELSEFYKTFLDTNYPQHLIYTKEWLKLQAKLTWNILKLNVEQMFTKNISKR